MSFSGGGAASGAASGAQAGMMFGPYGAAIGAVIGAIAGGIIGGKKKEAEKRAEANRRMLEQIQVRRERAQQIRQAQRASADITAQIVNQGAGESSVAQTAPADILGQLQGNLNFINAQQSLSNSIRNNNRKAQQAQNKLNMITSFGQAAGSAGGGFGGVM